jgi:cell filamentation protein
MVNRYDATGNAEGQYQPGSEGRVLLNKLEIIDPVEVDNIELSLLEKMQYMLVEELESVQRFTVTDLCDWYSAGLEVLRASLSAA